MTDRAFSEKVAELCHRKLGGAGPVENLERLTGGANMESWGFVWDGCGYVLRCSPSAEFMVGRSYDHPTEARIVQTAFECGVKAPEVVAVISDEDDLGSGYMMRRAIGDVQPQKILTEPAANLLNSVAEQLALIHAIPAKQLPKELKVAQARELLDDLETRFDIYGGDRPVFALALRWLNDHIPEPVEPVFLHGDFRIGNLMADADGLTAVLDWEICHLGDRHQDLAYGCINSWRFGHINRPAFGCGQFDDLFDAYQRHSGVAVDPLRFRFWLVYSTCWWGLACLQMAHIWRTGADTGLERAVIGRRASETEVDLLMLLESDAPAQERAPIAALVPPEPRRVGETSAVEMIEAISGWLVNEVKPNAQGRDRFMTAVALNALGMLAREGNSFAEAHSLEFANALRSGKVTLATPGVLARLKQLALNKLLADQPKYSAAAAAKRLWIQA
jgi:aminoglycoside phosphotransferase (APT) family kinase protein